MLKKKTLENRGFSFFVCKATESLLGFTCVLRACDCKGFATSVFWIVFVFARENVSAVGNLGLVKNNWPVAMKMAAG
jgi:hypothetical protein